MKNYFVLIVILFSTTFHAQKKNPKMNEIQPPIAKIIPKNLKKHGHVRIDNYYWLNERENPEVLAYLNQENEYYQKKRLPILKISRRFIFRNEKQNKRG